MHYKKEKQQKTDMKTMETIIHLSERSGWRHPAGYRQRVRETLKLNC